MLDTIQLFQLFIFVTQIIAVLLLFALSFLSKPACDYIKDNTKLFKELPDGDFYIGLYIILCAKKCYQLKKKGIKINGIKTEEDIDKLYQECITKKKDLKMSH